MRVRYVAMIALLMLYGCGDEPQGPQQYAQLDMGPDLGPIEESVFTGYKTHDLQDYDAAPNDIAKSRIAERWEKDACQAIKTPDIVNWTARVSGIVAGGALSKPGVILDIGDDVHVETNLSEGPILDRVSTLQVGQDVKFSGRFKPGENGCRVDLIGPPWGDSRIRKPDFDIDLSAINPA